MKKSNTLSPRTALIVEDDLVILGLLHEVLEDAGFDATAVDCGSPAMRLLAERHFDVLVSDVTLPDMNGMVICDMARERYQEKIVILVLTGQDIARRAVTSLQLCADAFLGKPFDLDLLIAIIERKLRYARNDNE